MAYVYESIQNGVFNFTIPGEDRSVQLLKGSRVTVKKKLAGSYLRVLKFVKEVPDKKTEAVEIEKSTQQKAKVEDKITKVEEVLESSKDEIEVKIADEITMTADEVVEPVVENVDVKVEDAVSNVKEEVLEEKPPVKKAAPKRKAAPRKKPTVTTK